MDLNQEKGKLVPWTELQHHISQWLHAPLQSNESLELSPAFIDQLAQKQFSISQYLDQQDYHLTKSPLRHPIENGEQHLYVSPEEDGPFLAIIRTYIGTNDAKYRAFCVGSKNFLQKLCDNFPDNGLESFL